MINFYKLSIGKVNGKSHLEAIYDFLDLYNGHPGYEFFTSVGKSCEYDSVVGKFVLDWHPYKEENIIALVAEDEDGNVLEFLFETESGTLRWSEEHFENMEKVNSILEN